MRKLFIYHWIATCVFGLVSLDVFNATVLAADDQFEKLIRPFLSKYCIECHGAKKVEGDVDFKKIGHADQADSSFEIWESAVELLKDKQMPPESKPQPTEMERAAIYKWYQARFVDSVVAKPGEFVPRRLSAIEFEKTLNSLMGFKLEVNIIESEQTVVEKSLVKKIMPPDPPGESGFTNDTHSSPLTTAMWDQYAFLVDAGLEELFSTNRHKALEVYTGPLTEKETAKTKITFEQAKSLVNKFVPRALRRPVDESKLSRILEKLAASDELIATLKFELKAVLMSPGFLYRGILMPTKTGEHPVDNFELAERLSYFIWADMPDAELTAAAGQSNLNIAKQVDRMLKSAKSRSLAEVFAFEWLSLDGVAKDSKNPPRKVALRSQPADFMNHLFTENRPLIDLIDSKVAFANTFTAGYYHRDDQKQMTRYRKESGIEVEIVPNQKLDLKHSSDRGGLLTMPGILMMNRGPILRGTWMMEKILGEELGDPPPDVGAIPQQRRGEKLTFRQRFEQHRSNSACAVCHDKIDPLGFAMQSYDNNGKFLGKQNKKAGGNLDTSGKLPSGQTFKDFGELKKIFTTTKRRVVIRNIVAKMLAYALARKLTLYDQPVVEQIANKLDKTNGSYRDLMVEIATSLPFTHSAIKEQTP